MARVPKLNADDLNDVFSNQFFRSQAGHKKLAGNLNATRRNSAIAAGTGAGSLTLLSADRVKRRKKVSKAAKPVQSDASIRRRKKLQGNISIAGGTLGLTALGLKGGSVARAGGRAGKLLKITPNKKLSNKLKDASTGVTTLGAGIGGLGAYNFASYTKAEARKRGPIKKRFEMDEISKAAKLPKVPGFARGTSRRVSDSGMHFSEKVGVRTPFNTPSTKLSVSRDVRIKGDKYEQLVSTKKTRAKLTPLGKDVATGVGAGTALGGSYSLYNRRKKKVSKAYDPERKRQRRLDNAATSLAAGAGAAGLGAAKFGRDAYGKKISLPGNKVGHSGLRAKSLPAYKAGVKNSGKAGALGLTAVGLAVGSDRVRSYKKGRGGRYRPLHSSWN